MKIKDYDQLVQTAAPKSKMLLNFCKAFLVGGLICTLGQALFELYQNCGADEESAKIITSVTLIAISAVLTALSLYDKLAKFGGGGTLVPITGFANAVVAPALDNKPEGKILGTGVQMFSIAGPVIVYGVLAANIYGLIYYILKLCGVM
ncbi:MAG: SpoVA/SpoVAEb family sporulation membrane protein [Clostridia bacterium]|nr:SpoVA/SpoVAEb family sporulation membrane protein [Clostridia bacterium]